MIVGGECSSEMLHVLTTKSRSLVQSVLDEADKRGKVFLDDMFDLRNLFLRIGFDPEDQYGESSEECSDGLCGDEEVNIGERHMRAYEQQEEDYWLKD